MVRRSRFSLLEILENREMLSVSGMPEYASQQSTVLAGTQYDSQFQGISGPSAYEQEMLEMINRMRMDPQGELGRLIKSFSPYLEAWDPRVTTALSVFSYPKASQLRSEWARLEAAAPLAWNASLCAAATTHNYLMLWEDTQSHQVEERGELPLFERVLAAGFEPAYKTGSQDGESVAWVSENVYSYGRDAYRDFSAGSYTHAAFALDWGVPDHAHRDNIMNPNFTDVGISMLRDNNPNTSVGTWLTTVDFGAADTSSLGNGAYLLGVVYDDWNGSGYYEAGEGIGGAAITVKRLDSGETETIDFNAFQAGGYQIFLENGSYGITVSGQGFGGESGRPVTKYATIQGKNVKLDFLLQDASTEPPVLDLNGPDIEGIDYYSNFLENGSPARLVSEHAILTDPDSTHLSSAKIRFENRPDGANEFLTIDTGGTGIQSSFDSASGELLLTGDASLADYLAVLKTLEYVNFSDKADLSDRTISIVVSDGVHSSEVAYSHLRITQRHFENLSLSVKNLEEGDLGTREVIFWLDFSDVPRCEVVIDYAFLDGTAKNGTHFYAQNGSLVVGANQTRACITAEIVGDYLPGDDLTFSLQLVRIDGAECAESTIEVTIYDDDTPLALGTISGWRTGEIDLSERHRRLYTFSPEQSGAYVWDNTGNARMSLFKGATHEGTPLAESGGRPRFEIELEKGTTYTLLLEGDGVLEMLRFWQNFLLEDEENGKLEIVLDPNIAGEIVFNQQDGYIEYQGIRVPFEPTFYPNIGFQNIGSGHVLKFVVSSNTAEFLIDTNRPTVPLGGVEVDIDGFSHLEYVVSDESTVVQILGTPEKDTFYFRDGVAVFTASNSREHTVRNGKVFEIEGGGGEDQGLIFDTPYQDYATFDHDQIGFFGGGETNYKIFVEHFRWFEITSYYGGYDIITLVNRDGSTAELDERLVIRTETDPLGEPVACYFTRGFSNVFVLNQGEAENTVILGGGKGDNICFVSPGQINATNRLQTYYHTVLGGTNIQLKNEDPRNRSFSLFYEELGTSEPAYWESGVNGDQSLVIPRSRTGASPGKLSVPSAMFFDFYYNGQKTVPEVLASSVVSQVLAETDSESGPLSQDVSEPLSGRSAGWWFEEEDTEWSSSHTKVLSLAEISLYYEDWNA